MTRLQEAIYCAAFVLLLFCAGCQWPWFKKELPPVQIQPTITNTIIKQVKVNDWLVTGSILIMGVGAFGFLNGWKQGFSLFGAALTVLGVSLVLKAYGAILVFAGAVCIAGIVGWQIWLRVRALTEVVGGVEKGKSYLDSVEKNLSGNETPLLAAKLSAEGFREELKKQSPATKSLVAGIRKKFNGATK